MPFVKTVYDAKSFRLPNVTEYKIKEDAEMFIQTCLRWGIGILSCKIISDKEAKELIASGAVETD